MERKGKERKFIIDFFFFIFDLTMNFFHTVWLSRLKGMEIFVFFFSKSFLVDVVFIFQAHEIVYCN